MIGIGIAVIGALAGAIAVTRAPLPKGPPPVVDVPGRSPGPLLLNVSPARASSSAPQRAAGPGPVSVALDNDDIYFLDRGVQAVMKQPKAGGDPVRLAQWHGPMARLTLSGDRLLFLTETELYSVPKQGGTPAALATHLEAPTDIAVYGGDAFITTGRYHGRGPNGPDGVIVRVPTAGGEAMPFVSGQPGPQSVAVDETDVYWTCQGGVMRASRATGAAALFARTSDSNAWHIAHDADAVYFTVTTSLGADIRRVLKVGGGEQVLARLKAQPAALQVGDTHIFFIAESEAGPDVEPYQELVATLWMLEKKGGGLTAVARGLTGWVDVAVDATHIAWTSGQTLFWKRKPDGEVRSVSPSAKQSAPATVRP
jgi:hypothetical protein